MIGISWNNTTSSGVEVELWDSAPQVETPPEPELKTEVKDCLLYTSDAADE